MTFLDPLRSRFGGLVADMSPRDRNLFLGLVLCVYLGALGAAAWGGKSFLADAQSRITAKQAAVTRLEAMETEYVANVAKVTEIEDTLRKNATQDFPSFAEKAAAKHSLGTNLKAVREKGATTEANLQVKTYTVELDRVSLAQLTDFLFELETTGYPLRIQTMRVKTNGPPGQRLLSPTFEVAAYKLDESGETAAGGAE